MLTNIKWHLNWLSIPGESLAARYKWCQGPVSNRGPAVEKHWYIPLLCVQWKPADDGQRNCPKHVEFYSKNNFEKLVHLIGFIIRICHDARSTEREISRVYHAFDVTNLLKSPDIVNSIFIKKSYILFWATGTLTQIVTKSSERNGPNSNKKDLNF